MTEMKQTEKQEEGEEDNKTDRRPLLIDEEKRGDFV